MLFVTCAFCVLRVVCVCLCGVCMVICCLRCSVVLCCFGMLFSGVVCGNDLLLVVCFDAAFYYW